MKLSEVAIEAIDSLRKFQELVANADDADGDLRKTLEVFCNHLGIEVFRAIVKNEYMTLLQKVNFMYFFEV